ncbi:hypothetical protein ACSBR1_035261 [Camellia fascicularis]
MLRMRVLPDVVLSSSPVQYVGNCSSLVRLELLPQCQYYRFHAATSCKKDSVLALSWTLLTLILRVGATCRTANNTSASNNSAV